MKLLRLCAAGMMAAAAVACSKDTDGELLTPDPVAGVRYVNVIPDTTALDIRVIDIVGNAPNQVAATFRTGGAPSGITTALLPPHQAVDAGDRDIRVFLNSTNPAIASTILLDVPATFVAGNNYTVYLYGYANPANGGTAMQALIVQDNPTDPGAQISTRVIHLAPTLAGATVTLAGTAVDVFFDGNAAGVTPSGAPTVANAALGSVGNYVSRAVGATTRAVATATGTFTPFIEVALPAGTVGTATANPIAGAGVAGTSMSIIVVPRSTAATGAPQAAAFTNPAIIVAVDRQPPRTAP